MTKKKPKDQPAQELGEQLEDQALNEQEQPDMSLEEQLVRAQEQSEEYLKMAQRVQADFDNFRRRTRQVASESFDDGARAFIKTLLPVCDNLERALQEPREDDPLYQGVLLVHRQLQDTLNQRGVQVISRQGEAFDPTLEDAVAQANPEDGEPGTVSDVVLKGYKMGDTVLRHAMVRVVPG
ncbi:MAG: nucleotide exchange factor GrpE [Christensenellales bacterium]|jgi:molecular chaperone GrpE|nr:nucleotide exchange factor GrpE [Clostridiales bacterium]